MTTGIAEPKRVYLKHHHQHLNRLQKDGDGEDSPWISGEELQTDGSSGDDNEEKGGAKPKQLRKLRKQTCKILKKEAECLSRQSKNKEHHGVASSSTTKTATFPAVATVVSGSSTTTSANITIPARIRRKTTPVTTSADEKVGRSQSLTESLNLENRWRPKRGSLKLPSLTAAETASGTDNNSISYLEDSNRFYMEMQAKVGRLKENARFEEIVHQTEEQTQRKKILKKIRSTIDAIETNHAETDSLIRTMRQERHQAHEYNAMWMMMTSSSTARDLSAATSNLNVLQMCDKNPQLFLDMMRFEENSQISADEEEMEECQRNADFENSLKAPPPGNKHGDRQENGGGVEDGEGPVEPRRNFVQRNIELAAKAMTSFPLTDDEKQKLDDLLKDIDTEEAAEQPSRPYHLTSSTTLPMLLSTVTEPVDKGVTEKDNQNLTLSNAFCMSDEDKQRIGEINVELDKFEETQLLRSVNDSSRTSDDFWKHLVLDQSLKEVDAKLENLKLKDDADESSSSFSSSSFSDQ